MEIIYIIGAILFGWTIAAIYGWAVRVTGGFCPRDKAMNPVIFWSLMVITVIPYGLRLFL